MKGKKLDDGPHASSGQYMYSSLLSLFQARVKFVYQLMTEKPGEKKQFLYLIGSLPSHLTITSFILNVGCHVGGYIY